MSPTSLACPPSRLRTPLLLRVTRRSKSNIDGSRRRPLSQLGRPAHEGGPMALSDTRTPAPVPSFWTAQSRVRLRTLILLRWMAVFGQTVAVVFVRYGLNVAFPIGWAMAAIGVSVALNLALIATRRSQELAREWEAAAQLAYDVVQLAVLLALTGGLQNPFVFLFIAPVAVSATV